MERDRRLTKKSTSVFTKENREHDPHLAVHWKRRASGIDELLRDLGNRTLQRLLGQRAGDAAFDLDDETAARINRERGGGQALDASLRRQAGKAMDHDLSGVRVHTSPEAHALNQRLSAKAFTTGQDIFFREGAYDPHSSAGQELIAHELTHVVQQSTGVVGGGSAKMTVNAPGDAFEREADAVAKTMVGQAAAPAQLQRQAAGEEEEEGLVQRQAAPEEDELVQTQMAEEEEEELVQTQALPEEEEEEELP